MIQQACCDKNMGEQFTCGQLRVEIDRLKSEVERLHQAHREGWEQAKREMAQEVDMEGGIKYKPGSWEQQALYKAANRIRAMEYKGAEKLCGKITQ